jgi:ubiquinone biosynthesis protein Coq4
MHDLHHVATGYDSSLLGEAEISVFELRAGSGTPLIFFLCCGSILVGLFLSPRRMWQAWKAARGTRSLYKTKTPYETLLSMDVAQLRELIGLEVR